MLINATMEHLRELSLSGMARALAEQMENAEYNSLTFEERLGMLCDREIQDRYNRRLERNLRMAKLRTVACIEDIDFRRARGLERSVVMSLASAQWVAAHQNVLIVGPTGAGKTFLGCALANAAVRAGNTALYIRAPRLFNDLVIARGDGRWVRLMAAWSRVDVLIIDDLVLQPVTPAQASDLLEVIEDRSQRRSTIVTSQLPIAEWHAALGDPTLADAILDRLTSNAHRIAMHGDSTRRREPKHTSGERDAPDQPDTAAKPAAVRRSAAR
jgi:DNA replication protein DnaC